MLHEAGRHAGDKPDPQHQRRTDGGFSFAGWAAIAATFGGGGGHVTFFWCVTVAPRMTSSSMS